MKKILLLLLSSCSLFQETPSTVIDGQRAVHQSLLIIKDNIARTIENYDARLKASAIYHYNYVYELKITNIKQDTTLSQEDKDSQISILEEERDAKIKEVVDSLSSSYQETISIYNKDIELIQNLVESVYNYMSTTPISVDNIQFYIDQLKSKITNG